jgi:hypothetical protein
MYRGRIFSSIECASALLCLCIVLLCCGVLYGFGGAVATAAAVVTGILLFRSLDRKLSTLVRAAVGICCGVVVVACISDVHDWPVIGIASTVAAALGIRAVSLYEAVPNVNAFQSDRDSVSRELRRRVRMRRSLIAIVAAPAVGIVLCAAWYTMALLFGNHLALLNFRSDSLKVIALFLVGGLITSVVVWLIPLNESDDQRPNDLPP